MPAYTQLDAKSSSVGLTWRDRISKLTFAGVFIAWDESRIKYRRTICRLAAILVFVPSKLSRQSELYKRESMEVCLGPMRIYKRRDIVLTDD
jgi:hypothetical protein